MPSPSVEDPARLRAVERSGLIDSAREPVFDELAALAAQLLDAPFAFVTAVDDKRSFWKSTYGIADGTRANSVDDSFCQYVIDAGDELIVGDAANHPLTADNPSIDSMGVAAWAGCPVILDGQTLGTFRVVDQRTRIWTERDREVLRMLAATVNREVGRRTTGGDERLDLDRAEVELLRSSMMPPEHDQPEGIDIAAWHRAASDSVLLGDFHDVVELDHDRSLLVIADVCGHGRAAAEVTAHLRAGFHRAAARGHDSAAIVASCNADLLGSSSEHGRFATASVMVLERAGDELVVRATSAGHPALLVRRRDGTVTALPAPDGPPLGVFSDAEFGQRTHRLARGDLLVGVTDGAIECRDAVGEQLGSERLAAILADIDAGTTAALAVERFATAILAFATDLTDDIAMVAVGLAD